MPECGVYLWAHGVITSLLGAFPGRRVDCAAQFVAVIKDIITPVTVSSAIVFYECTLLSPDGPFDYWLESAWP